MEQDLKNLKGVGPCTSSLDATLKMIGVQRQAYHSNSFVGNDCHTLLKEENIETLCNSIPEIVESFDLGDNELLLECKEQCDKFITLFKKYSACHAIFNSARYLSDDEIASLEVSIVEFLFHLRINWPSESVTPKLHMLEVHVIEFLSKWHVGLGYLGEQGGESVHNAFNMLRVTYNTVKKDTDRLMCMTNQHLLSCHPQASLIQPARVPQKIKKEVIWCLVNFIGKDLFSYLQNRHL